MGLVDLGEVALPEEVVEVEDVVLDLLAGYLLTQLLAHVAVGDNLIITYIIPLDAQLELDELGLDDFCGEERMGWGIKCAL